MSTKQRHRLLYIVVSVIGALYILHYVQLNLSYQKLKTGWNEIHYLGEEVSLGENYINISMQAQGYSICANTVEIVNTLEYTARNGISMSNREASTPERLALVSATIRKTGDVNTVLPVLLFEMYGIDTYTVVDFELFDSLNPHIKSENWGIVLPNDVVQEILIPFRLDRDQFNIYTWNHLEKYPLSMLLTYGPVRIIIQLTEN